MNLFETLMILVTFVILVKLLGGGRLEGVQDPERHLVGDVAERLTRQDDVEVRSREGAGVGEIGGAVELRGIAERLKAEGQRALDLAISENSDERKSFYWGWVRALEELQKRVTVTDDKRSDLSNSELSQPTPE